jgi:hypothetical protein
MKKELLYFAAGAVVMGAILYASQDKNIPIDCNVIAGAVSKGTDKGLTRKEKVAVASIEGRISDKRVHKKPMGLYSLNSKYRDRHKEAYKTCLRRHPY